MQAGAVQQNGSCQQQRVAVSHSRVRCVDTGQWAKAQKPTPPEPPFLAGCLLTSNDHGSRASQRNFTQADILDGGPDNCQATGLRREDVDLISPLPHIAKETFNGVSRLNVPVHRLRKRIKRQEVLFVFSQAPDRFWIAHSVLGECSRPVESMLPALSVAPRFP